MGTTLYLSPRDGGPDVELHRDFQAIIIANVLDIFSEDVQRDGLEIFGCGVGGEHLVPLPLLEHWLQRVEQQAVESQEWIYSLWRAVPGKPDLLQSDVAYVQLENQCWMIEAAFTCLRVRSVPAGLVEERRCSQGAVVVPVAPGVLPALHHEMALHLRPDDFHQIFRDTPLRLERNRIHDQFRSEFTQIRELIHQSRSGSGNLVLCLAV